MRIDTMRATMFALVCALGLLTRPAEAQEQVSDEIVIAVAPELGATLDNIAGPLGLDLLEPFPGRQDVFLVHVPVPLDPAAVMLLLRADPRVRWAAFNGFNDLPFEGGAFRSYASGGPDPGQLDAQAAPRSIGLPLAHALSTGVGARIAVVDTGVEPTHPLLAGRLSPEGYDFVDDDADPAEQADGVDQDADDWTDDGWGHGTHIAGVIAQSAPGAQIIPLRVLDSEGRGDDFTTAKAVHLAGTLGVDAINLSLNAAAISPFVSDILRRASFEGAALVAAAGNLGTDQALLPAADLCVLGVAAVHSSGRWADFSNFGPHLAIAAPGVGVVSSVPDAEYGSWSGTSMATPFVTSAFALIRELRPLWTLQERVQALLGTANDDYIFGSGFDPSDATLPIAQIGIGIGVLDLLDLVIAAEIGLPLGEGLAPQCAPQDLGHGLIAAAAGAEVELAVDALGDPVTVSLPALPEVSVSTSATFMSDYAQVLGLDLPLYGQTLLAVETLSASVEQSDPAAPAESWAGLTEVQLDVAVAGLVDVMAIDATAVDAHAQLSGSCADVAFSGESRLANAVLTLPLLAPIALPAEPAPNTVVDVVDLGGLAGISLVLNRQQIETLPESVQASVTAIAIELDVDVIGVASISGSIDLARAALQLDCSAP